METTTKEEEQEKEKQAALEELQVEQDDWTIDRAGGDPDVFFSELFSHWLEQALKHDRPKWKRERVMDKLEFEVKPGKTKGETSIRALKPYIVFMTLEDVTQPGGQMRDFPDWVCGRILLARCPEVQHVLLGNPELKHARYWIVGGPWKLEGLDDKAMKKQEEEMMHSMLRPEQDTPTPTPAPKPSQKKSAPPPGKPVVLVQTLHIWLDISGLYDSIVESVRLPVPTTALTK
jgi:hypothetical protein